MSSQNLSAAQLADLHNAADELLPKLQSIAAMLERIVELSDKIPSEDDVRDLERSVDNISTTLASIPELVEQLPCADDLDELLSKSG